jgi:hypothetical protein
VTNTSITYLIAAVAGVTCIALWAWLILVPAWGSFSRVWERLLATVMSLYVLAALVALGGGIAALVLYYYDEISL